MLVLLFCACDDKKASENIEKTVAEKDPVSFIMNKNIATNEKGEEIPFDAFELIEFYTNGNADGANTKWEEISYGELKYKNVINRGERYDLYDDDSEMKLQENWKYVRVTSTCFESFESYVFAYGLDDINEILLMHSWPDGTEYNGKIICAYVDHTEQDIGLVRTLQKYGWDNSYLESESTKNIAPKTIDSLSNSPEMATKYIDFIKRGFGEYGDVNFAKYYLYDVDKDGCEEILINAGTCEADAVLWFCKYINGQVVKIDNIPGGSASCSICGISEGEGVIVHYGTQGVESINRVTIKDKSLMINELVAPREVLEYTEFEYCTPLTYYSIDDMSPLENYGGVDNSKTNATEESEIQEVRDTRVKKSMTRSEVEELWGSPFKEVVENMSFGYIKTCFYYDGCNNIRTISYYSDGTIYGLFPDYELY